MPAITYRWRRFYRTGRWRSSYALDLSSSPATLTGRIQVHVHFFEQGNVQLTTDYVPPAAALALPESVTSSASPAEIAKSVIKTIKKAEEEYQMELNDAYREMSEKTFRNLRRALPVSMCGKMQTRGRGRGNWGCGHTPYCLGLRAWHHVSLSSILMFAPLACHSSSSLCLLPRACFFRSHDRRWTGLRSQTTSSARISGVATRAVPTVGRDSWCRGRHQKPIRQRPARTRTDGGDGHRRASQGQWRVWKEGKRTSGICNVSFSFTVLSLRIPSYGHPVQGSSSTGPRSFCASLLLLLPLLAANLSRV